MKKMMLAAAATVAVVSATPAHAGLIADITYDQQFGAGDGFALTGFGLADVYSIETRFYFDDLTSWVKIIDFKEQTSDDGWYNLNTQLNFYNVELSVDPVFEEGVFANLLVTRDATGVVNGYVDGELAISFDDSATEFAVFDNDVINLFIDDIVTNGTENSSGYLDFVRLYDMAITPAAAVPEPATWAMMILGFGLVGGALRRRKKLAPVNLAVSYS